MVGRESPPNSDAHHGEPAQFRLPPPVCPPFFGSFSELPPRKPEKPGLPCWPRSNFWTWGPSDSVLDQTAQRSERPRPRGRRTAGGAPAPGQAQGGLLLHAPRLLGGESLRGVWGGGWGGGCCLGLGWGGLGGFRGV